MEAVQAQRAEIAAARTANPKEQPLPLRERLGPILETSHHPRERFRARSRQRPPESRPLREVAPSRLPVRRFAVVCRALVRALLAAKEQNREGSPRSTTKSIGQRIHLYELDFDGPNDWRNKCKADVIPWGSSHYVIESRPMCTKCLDLYELELQKELREIAAGRTAMQAGVEKRHKTTLVNLPGNDGSSPDFVSLCDPRYWDTTSTFEHRKVTCPECLHLCQVEAERQLRRIEANREAFPHA